MTVEAHPRPTIERAPADHSANRLRLSIVDATFALLTLIPPLVFGYQLLNSDGDAARHIRMGRLIVERGLAARDMFSFTEPGGRIMLTEWGSRVLYFLAHEAFGLAGVALLGGLLIGASCALVVLFLIRRGVDPLLSYLIGIVTAVGGQVHWLARPHLFTLVGLALLLFFLEPAAKRRVWGLIPLFAVWSNLHGGFILGFVLLGVCLVGSLGEAWLGGEARPRWLLHARWYGSCLAVALLSSMLNPQGPLLIVHVLELLGNAEAIQNTGEFLSPNFHQFYGKLFLSILGGVIATLSLTGRRPDLRRLGIVLLLLAGALIARRNIPLFALVAVPITALHADNAWRAIAAPRFREIRRTFEMGEAAATPGLWIGPTLLIVGLLGMLRGSVAGQALVPAEFDPTVFPVEAVAWARENGVNGRPFHAFTWGGYIVYAWPEQPIFIDGMTDYFSPELLRDFRRINRLEAGWRETFTKWEIDLVLMPPESGLVYALEQPGEWNRLYEDSVAVVLSREPVPRDGR